LNSIYAVVFLFLFSACSFKMSSEPQKIADLNEFSQDISTYTKGIERGYISDIEAFKKDYFRVWNIEKIETPLEEAMWVFNVFTPEKSFGENLQKIDKKFFDTILENSNFQEYATLNLKALTLERLNLRAAPTDRPILRDPKLAGEGFPFDYLQNSTIEANKPILVSHCSKDRAWVFVESSFAHGWVRGRDIVFINQQESEIWQNARQTFLLKDNLPIYDEEGHFLFKSHIGMVLPLVDVTQTNNVVLTASGYKNDKVHFHSSLVSSNNSSNEILAFNSKNINSIVNELLKVNYGWGGMFGQRDCSSTMRDFFIPFGIWLPRNSYKQSQVGEVIVLKDMSNDKKIETIKKYGVPFETLLYKQGHIVLYVGVVDNKVIIFQNLWGVKTRKDDKDGRYIVGRTVFSTLEIGKNLKYYDEDASLLKNLKSMNIVTKLIKVQTGLKI